MYHPSVCVLLFSTRAHLRVASDPEISDLEFTLRTHFASVRICVRFNCVHWRRHSQMKKSAPHEEEATFDFFKPKTIPCLRLTSYSANYNLAIYKKLGHFKPIFNPRQFKRKITLDLTSQGFKRRLSELTTSTLNIRPSKLPQSFPIFCVTLGPLGTPSLFGYGCKSTVLFFSMTCA